MPLYDYECRHCGTQFEALRSVKDNDSEVVCPNCREKDAERKVSLTASDLLKTLGGCGSGRGPMRFG
jgi:putative FmdB family regulatory protein